jgi:hypothetical protein
LVELVTFDTVENLDALYDAIKSLLYLGVLVASLVQTRLVGSP